MLNNSFCPCGSGLSYTECCHPFHLGTKSPKTATELMRSRYSAYAKGEVDYIINTTHPNHKDSFTPKNKRRASIEVFCKITHFEKLEILDSKEDALSGTVVFRAFLYQDGQDVSFTEKSTFEKIGDQWFYLKGIINQN